MNEAFGDPRLRIAFAGAGAVSVFHLTGWRQTPHVEIVAVCDPVLERHGRDPGVHPRASDGRAVPH